MSTIITDRPYYPSLLLSPDESRDRNGPVTPTINGGVRVIPSDRNEWIITEATTNIFQNPSFEVDLGRTGMADGTTERTDEHAYIGDYSIKATSSGSLPRVSVFTNTTEGQDISFSAWVYHELGTDRVFQTHALGSDVDHTVPSGTWTRIGHSGIAPGGTTYFQFRLLDAAVGDVFYVDAVQIEEKPYATPYCDGSLGAGHAWTGLPHLSMSTREYSKVVVGKQINAWQVAEGTTNLFHNPGAAVNAEWLYPIRGTLDRVEVPIGHSGYGFRYTRGAAAGEGSVITNAGSIWSAYMHPIPVGSPVTISMWMRNPNREVEFRAMFGDSSDATLPSQRQYVSASAEWQKVELTYVTDPTAVTVSFYFTLKDSVEGDLMELTDIQIEAKPYATPLAVGDMGSGFSWAGTPHASRSTRAAGLVSLTPAQAAVVPWMKGSMLLRTNLVNSHGAMVTLGYIYGSNNNFISMRSYDGSYYQMYGGNSPNLNYTPPTGIPLSTGHNTLYLEWDGEDIAISLNGSPKMYGKRATPVDMPWASWGLRMEGSRWREHEAVLAFDTPLSDAEITRLVNMPEAWTWRSVGQQVIRPQEVTPYYPRPGSRVTHVETVVYETDRNNEARKPLSGVTSVKTDWDIDRAGSKARVDIATHKRSLRDGMWIAPHLVITPEVGDIVEQQLGHFRLGMPSTVIDGSVDTWGDDKVEQAATGGDIVDLLANASLPYTFYTPVGGNVMSDVKFLIKLATMGVVTPIPLANHSFEADPLWDGWATSFSGGAAGYFSAAPGSGAITVADGSRSFGITFNEGSRPVNGYGYALQYVTIPAGATRLMLTGLHLPYHHAYRGAISLQFRDADNNIISTNISYVATPHYAARWYRTMVVADVPENAVTVRVYVESRIVADDAPYARPMWDDIRLYSITGDPIPDSRINLPPSSAVASTRIQTTAGSSIGYEAINADRLSAIGHHAIYTDLTGRLTSSPSRDLATATVARTYGAEDYRLVGTFEVQRSANNRYNTVTAVKESFEEGVPPLFTTVWNDDPDDPWSVHHLGNVRYPNGPLMVQDAVDTEALEASALAVLARASMQNELRISVLPDPGLSVHDVIEIEGGPEEAQGRWLIESLRPGTDAGDPVVEIGARRTLSRAAVSSIDMGGG